MQRSLKIGELAGVTGCQVETIRYYEHEGLLSEPVRSEGNFRIYGNNHLQRLQFILHCRKLDMTLNEIRRLLKFRDAPEETCTEVNILIDEHIGHVAKRISELKVLKKQLKELRNLCQVTQSAGDCGILKSLAESDDLCTSNTILKNINTGLHKTHR
jgi:Cd(II)/Pb(II)-responsive transcriptional regulator